MISFIASCSASLMFSRHRPGDAALSGFVGPFALAGISLEGERGDGRFEFLVAALEHRASRRAAAAFPSCPSEGPRIGWRSGARAGGRRMPSAPPGFDSPTAASAGARSPAAPTRSGCVRPAGPPSRQPPPDCACSIESITSRPSRSWKIIRERDRIDITTSAPWEPFGSLTTTKGSCSECSRAASSACACSRTRIRRRTSGRQHPANASAKK